MGDLTRNFSRSEFACSCGCKQIGIDYRLVLDLQECCDDFEDELGNPVRCEITSGNRCKASNIQALMKYSGKTREEAEQSKSMHLFCMAADFKMYIRSTGKQIKPEKVASYFEDKYPDSHGIGRYDNRTHLDTRKQKARWG